MLLGIVTCALQLAAELVDCCCARHEHPAVFVAVGMRVADANLLFSDWVGALSLISRGRVTIRPLV